jgi:hypothetical protein
MTTFLSWGAFPLSSTLIIGKTRLSHVVMDGGSSLNLLYAETCDAITRGDMAVRHYIPWSHTRALGHPP